MEMNTRLQVEHPVTEMITGQDLVEWQLHIAAGAPLPLEQHALNLNGHAVEVRLYAEDPARDFLPACGKLIEFRTPPAQAGLRLDSGVTKNDTITPLFDPMLAKLIVHADSRELALTRLAQALSQFRIAGVTTNLAFLHRLATHPELIAGHVDTGFIERHRQALLPAPSPPEARELALVALADALAAQPGDDGVWAALPGWRLSGGSQRSWHYRHDSGQCFEVVLRFDGDTRLIETAGQHFRVRRASFDGQMLDVEMDGIRHTVDMTLHGKERFLFLGAAIRVLTLIEPGDEAHEADPNDGHLKAPLPGRVVALCAEHGARVARGAPLIILEAMKMEHTLLAPTDGTVTRFYFKPGERVEEGADLLDFASRG